MTTKTRIIFMGTPDFSVLTLEAILASPLYDVVGVYSQPPRPTGRGHRVIPSPVHQCAKAHGILVRHPLTLKTMEEQEKFHALNADIAIVVAYGLLLPKPILESPRFGCLNIHASLLPRWRGAAPIQRAIEAGDQETGITLMQMDVGLDTGPMLQKETVPITTNTTAKTLHDHLSILGASLLMKTLPLYLKGNIMPQPQPTEGVTYAHKLEKEEGHIDWSESASTIERKIRALTPFPGTWFFYEGQRIKIHGATVSDKVSLLPAGTLLNSEGLIVCGKGMLRPTTLQKEGGKPLPLDEFLRGFPLKGSKILS